MVHEVNTSTVLAKADWEVLFRLWNTVYPEEIQKVDTEALRLLIEVSNCIHYVIRDSNAHIKAWMTVFDRYDTRWFSILVSDDVQGKGMGKALILHAQSIEPILEGWVVQSDKHLRPDGLPYVSPLSFYWKLGFRQNPNRFPSDGKIDVVCVKWKSDR